MLRCTCGIPDTRERLDYRTGCLGLCHHYKQEVHEAVFSHFVAVLGVVLLRE